MRSRLTAAARRDLASFRSVSSRPNLSVMVVRCIILQGSAIGRPRDEKLAREMKTRPSAGNDRLAALSRWAWTRRNCPVTNQYAPRPMAQPAKRFNLTSQPYQRGTPVADQGGQARDSAKRGPVETAIRQYPFTAGSGSIPLGGSTIVIHSLAPAFPVMSNKRPIYTLRPRKQMETHGRSL